MEPDEDEELDDRGQWLASPYTRKLSKAFDSQREEAHKGLMHACAQTTDPKVAIAFGAFTAFVQAQGAVKPRRANEAA